MYGLITLLSETVNILTNIDSILKMIELSSGTEVIVNIIREDILSYELLKRSNKNSSLLSNRVYNDSPRCLIDILGNYSYYIVIIVIIIFLI